MAKSLFWLSDEAWRALNPHLPGGRPGKLRVDDRTVISGILHVLKTGCRWRDVPSVYGPPTTRRTPYPLDRAAYKRRNVIERLFCKLKNWRRVATRYDRLARNYLSGLALAAIIIALT